MSPLSIRAAEAQIGRTYWQALFASLEKHESVKKRTRQPAEDPVNALLNYGYGMLYAEVETAVLTAGLDPHLGILHAANYGRPAFVFDGIEPFRPGVDRLVVELILKREVKSEGFDIKGKAVWLNKTAKGVFIPAYVEMMQKRTLFNGKRIKRKDQIQYFFTQLAQRLANGKETT